MNKEFTKYLLSISDLGRQVWLLLYSESTPNGNAVVNYRELASTFNTSLAAIKKAFDPTISAKKGLVEIVTRTENTVVINFKGRGRPAAKKLKPAKKAPKNPIKASPPQKTEKSKLPIPIDAPNPANPVKKSRNKIPAVIGSALISSNENDLHPVPAGFKFTEDLKRRVIGEYCGFWKDLQASQQAMAGIHPDKIKTFNPMIKPIDIRNLCDISYHLYNNGFKSDELVVSAFRVIFSNWHYYRDFVQTGTSTTMLLRNLNEIILVNQTLKAKNYNGNRKREKELTGKLQRIENKDYSHLDSGGRS